MNRISFQWRITLMTAVLIAGACICLNLLLYHSGATGMDNLNGYVLQYQQNDDENLMIEIPDDQMSDFLIQFSQEVYDAKAVFGRKGWCITAAVTLLSAAIAYFVSGKALEPLKKLARQAERIDQDSLVEVRLEENTIPEFRDLSQSVNRMLDRLAHSFDLQRQFAGNAAHELKTPLAIMQAKLEMFAEEHPDADSEITDLLRFQTDQVSRLASLVRTLLEMSDLQSIPREDHIELAPVADEIVADLTPLAQRRQKKSSAVLRVADTGCGIPEEYRTSVFQPFFRVDKSRSREMGGVGLGLALVREIALLHGGTVTAEPADGHGTVFTVTLPIQA